METPKVKRRSLIKKYISNELYLDVLKVTLISDIDNNEKSLLIRDLLTKYNIPWTSLGNGTNRYCYQLDGYAVKVALDNDGINYSPHIK